jgi:AcrR family transcriptional regulator
MKKTPLEKLREKGRKARQNIIVDAAEQVFATKPFLKVSMRDISRESQVSLSSIYRYFPDQESLFLEALIRGAGKATLMIKNLVSQEDIGVDKVAISFIDYLVEHDQYFRMMTHFMLDGVLNPASIEKLNKMERDLLDQFDNLFKKLNPKSNSRILAHAFFASLNGILITYRKYPGRDIKDVHKHMGQLGIIISKMFSGMVASED